jgi:hypothetical protein
MQTKAKVTSVMTTEWSGDLLTIEVLGVGALMFDRTLASPANRDQAEKHGWTQRLSDRAAKSAAVRKPGMTEEAWAEARLAVTKGKHAAVEALIAYYESGEVSWKMSGGGTEGGMLLEALLELYEGKKTGDQIRAFLGSRTDEQLKTLRKVPGLVEIMNRLRAERAGEVDVEAALGELDDMES